MKKTSGIRGGGIGDRGKDKSQIPNKDKSETRIPKSEFSNHHSALRAPHSTTPSNPYPLSSNPFPLSSRLIGLGVDIIEIKRIKELIRRNKNFLSRVFTEAELKYCLGKKNQYQRLAVRFSAKEAVWKAAGLKGMPLRDISIVKAPGGRPGVECGDSRARSMDIQISLSHSDHYAAAVAVAIKRI